jgi:hypothetical protein
MPCLKLDRFVEGNREALAVVRVPTEEEEQHRAIHRQREQLVKARKRLEAQGRSLMVNHGMEPVNKWWKRRTFAQLPVPAWMKRAPLPQPTDPHCLGREDPDLDPAIAKGGRSWASARFWCLEQCGDRPGGG